MVFGDDELTDYVIKNWAEIKKNCPVLTPQEIEQINQMNKLFVAEMTAQSNTEEATQYRIIRDELQKEDLV